MFRLIRHVLQEEPQEVHTEGNVNVNKKHNNLTLSETPDFYAEIGRLEGHLNVICDVWSEGTLTLVVEKRKWVLEGVLSTYEEGDVIEQQIKIIKDIADHISKEFGDESSSFTITFTLQNVFECEGKVVVH